MNIKICKECGKDCKECGKEQNIPFETTVILCYDPTGKVEKTTMYSCQHIIDSIEKQRKFSDNLVKLCQNEVISLEELMKRLEQGQNE